MTRFDLKVFFTLMMLSAPCAWASSMDPAEAVLSKSYNDAYRADMKSPDKSLGHLHDLNQSIMTPAEGVVQKSLQDNLERSFQKNGITLLHSSNELEEFRKKPHSANRNGAVTAKGSSGTASIPIVPIAQPASAPGKDAVTTEEVYSGRPDDQTEQTPKRKHRHISDE